MKNNTKCGRFFLNFHPFFLILFSFFVQPTLHNAQSPLVIDQMITQMIFLAIGYLALRINLVAGI